MCHILEPLAREGMVIKIYQEVKARSQSLFPDSHVRKDVGGRKTIAGCELFCVQQNLYKSKDLQEDSLMQTQDNKTGSKWLGGLILIIIVGAIIAVAVSLQPKPPTTDTSAGKNQPAKAEEKTSNKWDYEENYNKIQNGMTKGEVEAAIDRKSENCAESTSEELNLKVESCNYGMPPDNGMISVTLENGKVTGKAKAAF